MLPVFRSETTGKFLIQSPDIRSERIQAFVALEDAPSDEITEFNAKRSVHVGTSLIYVFQDGNSNIFSGSLDNLRDVLNDFLNKDGDLATKLQIAELVGSISQKKDLRQRMTEVVESAFGEDASDNFSQTSLFLQALWSHLVNRVSDEERLELLSANKKMLMLEADASLEGVFPLNIQQWLSEDLDITISDVVEEMAKELPFSIQPHLIHRDTKPAILRERIFHDLEEIQAAPRQEARIARLIRRVMENPGVGKHLAQQFDDRAQFARKAARLLLLNIGNFALSPDPRFIGWFIETLYRFSYPRQRGVLLYELANYLGDFEVFSEPILALARNSQSEAVRYARKAIEERIFNRTEPSSSVLPPRSPAGYYSAPVRRLYRR